MCAALYVNLPQQLHASAPIRVHLPEEITDSKLLFFTYYFLRVKFIRSSLDLSSLIISGCHEGAFFLSPHSLKNAPRT